MPKEGFVDFEELDIKFGYSMTPGSLTFYTEEEIEFRNELREYVAREVLPYAEKIEKERDFELIRKILRKMGKDGWLGTAFPEEIGGKGKGVVYRTILCEEISAISAAVDVTRCASCDLFGFPVLTYGTPEQREKFLIPVIKGEKIGALGITEPTGGCDAIGGMKTRAVRDGDEYIITGEKCFQMNGGKADFILLYAITNPDVKPTRGMSAFIFPTDTEGFEVVREFELMGRRGSSCGYERFNECRIPADYLLGEENKGLSIMLHGLNAERTSTCAQYLGICRSAFEVATKYAAERVQFGEPIRNFQGVNFKIAEMYADIEAMRMMTLRAARMLDAGLDAGKEVAAAKFFCADRAVEVCTKAMQVVGGRAYTTDYPIERYYRDIRSGQIAAGSSEMSRRTVQNLIYRELGYR
ncbi:MAG: acyl-CoA dehydrogenase family protein [Candidatus Syntropharchaeia archaeon]